MDQGGLGRDCTGERINWTCNLNLTCSCLSWSLRPPGVVVLRCSTGAIDPPMFDWPLSSGLVHHATTIGHRWIDLPDLVQLTRHIASGQAHLGTPFGQSPKIAHHWGILHTHGLRRAIQSYTLKPKAFHSRSVSGHSCTNTFTRGGAKATNDGGKYASLRRMLTPFLRAIESITLRSDASVFDLSLNLNSPDSRC